MAHHWYIVIVCSVGEHTSLCGNYVTKLRAFTVQAEAEGLWAHKRDPERSSSSRKGSDLQRGVPDGNRRMSPHVVSIAGRCPLVQRSISYYYVFRGCLIAYTSVTPVQAADLFASDQSSLAELCRQGFNSGYTSVDVGSDTGVSGFSNIPGLSVYVSRSGCYLVRGF